MTQLLQGGAFPRSFLDIAERLTDPQQAAQASKDLNSAFVQAFQSVYTVQQNLNNAATAGGIVKVTGTSLKIPTGLKTVTTVVVSIDNGVVAENFWVSAQPSAVNANTIGAIDIFVWQPTGAGSTVPVAGTTAVGVRWIAFGSK